jgi:hypothetical protein
MHQRWAPFSVEVAIGVDPAKGSLANSHQGEVNPFTFT